VGLLQHGTLAARPAAQPSQCQRLFIDMAALHCCKFPHHVESASDRTFFSDGCNRNSRTYCTAPKEQDEVTSESTALTWEVGML
jgi:hypothetical protein